MKYMIHWNIPTENYKTAVEAFLNSGAPMPEGVTAIGRWHAPGSSYGWLLAETDEIMALTQHLAEWAILLEYKITPVIEDDEAAGAIAKVIKP